LVVAYVAALGQCDTCEAEDSWTSSPPFERSLARNSPSTLGLPTGERAPAIEGIAYENQRTILAVFSGFGTANMGILRWLAELSELQVVAVLAGFVPSSLDEYRESLSGVTVISDPQAGVAAALYCVGSFQRVVFFVDEHGTIVYRRRGGIDWLGHDDRALAREFSATGQAPRSAIPQQVLWFGDQAAWPNFTLQRIDGSVLTVSAGQPRLILWGRSLSRPEDMAIQRDLDLLRLEYPNVEFIWVITATSDHALEEMWKAAQVTGLAEAHPEWFALELDKYMEAAASGRDADLAPLLADVAEDLSGWQCVVDWDSKLGVLWTVAEWPAILILDREGTVMLPVTTYPVNSAGGDVRTHPKAVDELRGLLELVTGERNEPHELDCH